jgi:hypothetical protein
VGAAEDGLDEAGLAEDEADSDNPGSLDDPGSMEPDIEPGTAGPDLTGDDS